MRKQKPRIDSKMYLYRGNELTLSELSRVTLVNKATLRGRLLRGMSVEQAICPVQIKTVIARSKAHWRSDPKKVQTKSIDDVSVDTEIDDTWIDSSTEEKREAMRKKKIRENDFFEARVLRETMGCDFE